MKPFPVKKNESVTNEKTDDTPGDRYGASSNTTEFPLTISNQMMVSTISSLQRQRDLAVKELGINKTAFIGPACRPETATSKPDIEESLNEFYQELKQIDQLLKRSPGDSSENDVPFQTRKGFVPPVPKGRSHNIQERTPGPNTHRFHRYQDEPYHVRRQGTSSNQNPDGAYYHYNHDWQPPPPHQNQPYLLSHSLPRCTPLPPHPVLFGPPHREPHVNRNWGYPEREKQDQQQGLRFPPAHRALVPEGSSYFQDYGGAHSYHRDKRCYNGNSYENVGCSNLNEGHNSEWYQGYNRQHDTYQQQDNQHTVNTTDDHHPSLILILMRGLPGSGKSTFARELLSTRTSGLVLSTDDYFSQEKGYLYDSSLLGIAHDWNQNRGTDAPQPPPTDTYNHKSTHTLLLSQ